MLIGWLRTPRVRLAAQVTGALAALAMIIVGCTSVTDGEAGVSAGDAPAYRASVSASLEESAASSSARESERQSSVTAEAVKSFLTVASHQGQAGLPEAGYVPLPERFTERLQEAIDGIGSTA